MTDTAPAAPPAFRRSGWWWLPLVAVLSLLTWYVWPVATQQAVPQFVGSSTCAGCHAGEFRQWQQSHHHLAMQAVTTASVLGDFNHAWLDQGDAATFFRRGESFVVRTDGPEIGRAHV